VNSLSRRSFLATASGTAAAIFTGKSRADYAGDSFSPSNDLPAELTPLVKQKRTAILDAMAQHDIPGAAVSLIYKGKAVWTEGFGVTDRIAGRPVNTRTIFSIQSTTKNITATAILLAVQKGILNLDRPITTYLPGFSVNSRFESAPQEKMTLRLLLSHTAGFTHEAPIGNNFLCRGTLFDDGLSELFDVVPGSGSRML
jgi:CubicO group peptidase (beta-lactamase class C family)